MIIAAFVLAGCSDFDEMRSQRLLVRAEALIEQGNQGQAEAALAELVALYPATQAADLGLKRLASLQRLSGQRERLVFSEVLDSFEQVLNGYLAVYAEYPRSISALDEGDFLFDSGYLEEITPAGYQVYLFLQGDGAGYQLWCVHEAQALGYSAAATEGRWAVFEKEQTLAKLREHFSAARWDAKVVVLSSL